MTSITIPKLGRSLTRQFSSLHPASPIRRIRSDSSILRKPILPILISILTQLRSSPASIPASASRAFTTSQSNRKGISPETDNPMPKEPEEQEQGVKPAELEIRQYHELADFYMDQVMESFYKLQEEREDVDVEYSDGVINLTFPPNGKYVINKQPPNKQIWFSSPISGPKRFDFVIKSEGQNAKEGTGLGEWVYLRDGTTLGGLLRSEIGVDLSELADEGMA